MSRSGEVDITKVLENKLVCDGLSEAINMAKEKQLSPGIISQLSERYKSAHTISREHNDQILRLIPEGVCFIQAPNNWCAIRFTERNKSGIIYRPILPKDLIALEVDPMRKRDYTESELCTILLSIEDSVSLDLYDQRVIERAEWVLQKDFGVEAPKASLVPRVSSHSCLRWVQRKLRVEKNKAEEYRRNHYEDIVSGVIEAFSKATLVWTDEEDIDYYLDDKNMVYIVGSNVIITVYELDFGFTPEINSIIAVQQLQVLKQASMDLADRIESHDKYAQETERNLSEVDYEIRILKNRLEELTAQKTVYLASKDLSTKALSRERSKFNAEFNKLFRTIKDK